MAIAQRTATSGTAASGAGFSITLPAGVAAGDMLVVGITNATTTGPAAPTGWTRRYSASAGTLQCVSVYTAPYSAGLTLAFTNVAAIAAWVCNAYWQAGTVLAFDAVLAATSTGNNATLPTGAPVTGSFPGDFEVLIYGWTSSGTISGVASGSTIEITRANGTTASVALGRNNTTSLGASVTCTAFSQTLSASNTRKTGVGLLLALVPVYKDLTGTAAGQTTVTATIDSYPSFTYRDITGSANGLSTVGGPAFGWGSSNWAAPEAIWGNTGVTIITGGPPVAGPKDLYGTAQGRSTVIATPTRRRALVAASAGLSTVSGVVSRRRLLVPSGSQGQSTVAGAISARRTLTGSATGRSTAFGSVDKAGSVFKPILGSSAGKTTVTALLTRRRALAGASVGRTIVTALVTRRRPLVAAAVGRATVSASPSRRRPLVGSSLGQSTTGGVISSAPSVPLTAVIWVGDHFEMGQVGTLVRWSGSQFRTDMGDQVIWEDEMFKEAVT